MNPQNLIDSALMQPLMQSMHRLDYVWASSMGFLSADGKVYGGCRRQEFYRMSGAPSERRQVIENARKALYGTYCAKAEVELAKRARVYIDDEVAVLDGQHKASGKIDLVIIDPSASTDPYIGIEIKSIYSYPAIKRHIRPARGERADIKESHMAQAAFYAWKYRGSIKRWWVRYIARDTGDTGNRELSIMPDGSLSVDGVLSGRSIDELFAWTACVHAGLTANTLPQRDFQLLWTRERMVAEAKAGNMSKPNTEKALKGHKLFYGDFQCRYCNYVSRCQSEVMPTSMTVAQALEELIR